MKKFIALICLMLSMCFIFSACQSNEQKNWKKPYVAGEVSSNGGFATKVGDYVYFINGIEDATAKNTWGKSLVKGSLSRIKESDLADPDGKSIVVVPQIFSSSYYKTGLCIFGDYVYYATPSTKKDKKGEVQNEYISFQKTKLDGTNTKIINDSRTDMGVEYKYIENNGSVYLVIVETADEKSTLSVYNTSGSKVFEREEIDSYVIAEDYATPYIFYTDLDKDSKDNDEDYGVLYVYELGGEEKIVVKAKADVELSEAIFGTSGYTFKLTRNAFGRLFLNYTPASIEQGEGSIDVYVDIADLTFVEEDEDLSTSVANFDKFKTIDISKIKFADIINDTCVFLNENEVIYMDKNSGLVKFDLREVGNSYEGRELIASLSNMKVTEAILARVEGDYAYYLDNSSAYLWRVSLTKDFAENIGEQITSIAIDKDWYNVEVFGDYVLAVLDSDPFGSYVYSLEVDVASKLAAENDTTDEEEIKTFVSEYFEDMSKLSEKENEELFEKLIARRIGKIKSADKDSIDSYIESNYTDSSSSSK